MSLKESSQPGQAHHVINLFVIVLVVATIRKNQQWADEDIRLAFVISHILPYYSCHLDRTSEVPENLGTVDSGN